MNNLEIDLQESQKNIVSWLTEYEKVNEDIVKLSYNSKMYDLLDAIACFDVEKIKSV